MRAGRVRDACRMRSRRVQDAFEMREGRVRDTSQTRSNVTLDLSCTISITVLCLLCSLRYTELWAKNYSKSMSVIKVATKKNTMVPCTLVIVWNWGIHCPSLSAVFNLLHSSTNQELFEKHLRNKSSHYEKYGKFLITQRKPSRATTKLMFFAVSKDEWNTKEDTGKSLKNAFYILQYAKRHFLGWSDVKQYKNQTGSLGHSQVTLVWRHQAVS